MKTRIKQVVAAAIFTLLLMGGNSFAKGTELVASSMKTIVEPAMEIENWMVDYDYWNRANTAYFYTEVTDEDLVLEPWMTNENAWENIGVNNVETEIEANLVLENWMTDTSIWENESFNYAETSIEEIESDLILESWMIDENTWNIQ